jgi:hypothetical protein
MTRKVLMSVLRAAPKAFGLTLLGSLIGVATTREWVALIASALLFAHPFSLWDCFGQREPRALRCVAVVAVALLAIVVAALFGAQGIERATPLQGFVWTVLAVCVFPTLLDRIADAL